MHRFFTNRRFFINKHCCFDNYQILEFGPLDAPTFMKHEARIYYADYFSHDELIKKHKGKRNPEHIVQPDFLLANRTLSEAIEIRPDLVIANHMIEHLPNPIKWFRQLQDVSHGETLIFLSIPDKRYTFDFFKPVSDAVDWIRAYDEGLDRPNEYQIIRQLYYHASNSFVQYWEGTAPKDHLHRITMVDAIKQAKILSQRYSDVHCYYYTPESFVRIFDDLKSTKLIPWSVVEVTETEFNSNEFYVMMKYSD
ncbi:hypothetical protein DSECCO2_468270 [anaerobic digester metagenome]